MKVLHRLIVTTPLIARHRPCGPTSPPAIRTTNYWADKPRLRLEAEILPTRPCRRAVCFRRRWRPERLSTAADQGVQLHAKSANVGREPGGGPASAAACTRSSGGKVSTEWLTTFDGADAQTACTTPQSLQHAAPGVAPGERGMRLVELAAGLGKRLAAEGPADDAGRIDFAFRLCFSRMPTPTERSAAAALSGVATSGQSGNVVENVGPRAAQPR